MDVYLLETLGETIVGKTSGLRIGFERVDANSDEDGI